MMDDHLCHNCGSRGMSVFCEMNDVPAHSCLLMPTREAALSYPRGDLVLAHCQKCGFISNAAFDPGLHEYRPDYEDQQSFSPHFNAFAQLLAERLIERYDLHGKEIVEIGCGKGDFLALLCRLGGNRGIGIDPACRSDRLDSDVAEQITLIQDSYSERYVQYRGDFICCRHTLEHIPRTAEFLGIVRRSVGDNGNTPVFFEVPDVGRVLRELAFWDIYYEHCSYFTPGSLARLFRHCGFDILDLSKDFDDQYLLIEARGGDGSMPPRFDQEDDLEQIARDVGHFAENYRSQIATWKTFCEGISAAGRRAALWGSGSKGVAFLTTLGLHEDVEFVVDINPHRQGRYMAGTVSKIVAPEFLTEYKPDVVLVMNPVYLGEIRARCGELGVTAEVIAV